MKYINKYNNFNPINESFEEEKRNEFFPDLVDILTDMMDDGYKVVLYSNKHRIRLNHYLESSEEEQKQIIDNFFPIYRAGNKIKSSFRVSIYLGSSNYDKFVDIVSKMQTTIGRLSDLGWKINNVGPVESNGFYFDDPREDYQFVDYKFEKDDIVTDGELPKKEEASEILKEFGLELQEFEYSGTHNNICYIGADSHSYDGKINTSKIKEQMDRINNQLGFNSYEYELSDNDTWIRMTFWVND